MMTLVKNMVTAVCAVLLVSTSFAEVEFRPVRGGRLKLESSVFYPRLYEFPNGAQRLDAELESNLNWAPEGADSQFQAKFIPWVWVNQPQPDSNHKKEFGAFFEAKEAWVEITRPGWDLRLGNQVFSWGAADRINPTDQINSLDLNDPFRPRKLPQTAIRFVLHPEDLPDYQLEIIGSPFFKDPRLPLRIPDSGTTALNPFTSRWMVAVPRSVQGAGVSLPLNYQISNANYPSTWMGAARLQLSRIAGWDFSLSYMNGVENLPRFAVNLSGNPNVSTTPITATLFPSYHRMQMWGIDGQGSIAILGQEVGLRFENALFFRDNSRIDRSSPRIRDDLFKEDYIWTVFGADMNLPVKVLTTSMYVNAQFVFYERMGSEAVPGALRIENLPSGLPMDRNTILFIQNRTEIGLSLNQAWVHSVRHGDGVYSPSIGAQVTDQWNINLGADWFYGRRPGFFAQFRDARRAILSMEYEF